MRVIVIGAGLGGLALANGLRGTGVDVAVYERDASPVIRGQGYRLHLGDLGIDALASVLAPERWAAFLAAAHTPGPRFVRLDPALRVLEEHDFGGRHLSVDRQELRDTLLADVKGLVTYGKRLTAFQAEDEYVTARFDDGTTATGEVLVGADGVGSAVRRQYLPHARVVGTGLTQLYGKIPRESAEDLDHVFSAVTGPGHRVVGIAHTRDYATLSFSARTEELPPEPHLLRSLVMEMTSGWHPRIRRMLADWREIFPLVLRTSVPIAPWDTTRVTLLGDAAHAMSPAGGAGANLALRDAASLAAALAGGRPLIPELLIAELRSYEREMIDSGFAAVRASAANGVRVLGQDPLPS